MIITKPSFYEYILDRDEADACDDILEAIMSEMPMQPIRFKNQDTGEFGNELHHASSTLPIFTDMDDILYLYQFPPEFWNVANAYRYNKALYEAKKNPKSSDYHDIQFKTPGAHSNIITFKNRNTFAHKLLDKIERTVDVKHFATSDKHPEKKTSYSDLFSKNRELGIDMGGTIGADLTDPQRSDRDPNLWASKAFVGPDPSSVKEFTSKWMDASSHGLLGDPNEGTFNGHKIIKMQGGAGAKRKVKALSPGKLMEIAQKMQQAGAVPFKIRGNHPVWDNVEITSKKGTRMTSYPSEGNDTYLPILFPGKAIDSHSAKQYELNKHIDSAVNKVTLDDVGKNFPEILRKQDEAKHSLLGAQNRREKNAQALVIKKLEPIVQFGKWIRDIKKVEPTSENLNDLKIEFSRHVHDRISQIGKSAKAYDAYDWNVHRFNHDREDHDPLGVGMGNPLRMGSYKYPPLRDSTQSFGAFFPNRQNQSMLHGDEGDWENHFQHLFGMGGEKHQVKPHITDKEFEHVQRKAATYASKIGETLAADSDIKSFLGSVNAGDLTSPRGVSAALRRKEKELNQNGQTVSLITNGKLANDDTLPDGIVIPQKLRTAWSELNKLEKDLGSLHSDVDGNASQSDIKIGVETAINKKFDDWPVLKAALDANKTWIIYNAEKVVKRSMGEAPFRQYLDVMRDSTSNPLDRHKHGLEAKLMVRKIAQNYTEQIAQLNLDSIGTRRLRTTTGKTLNFAEPDDGGSYEDDTAAGTTKRIEMRGTYEDPETKAFIDSYFGDMEKSKYRRNRADSDSTSYTIGHHASTVHQQIANYAKVMADKVHAAVEAGAKKFAAKTGETDISTSEREMLEKIGNSIALYDFFKAMYLDKKLGMPAGADKWAKDKMMNVLKRHNLVNPNDENDYEGMSIAMRHTPADNYERRAGAILRSWEEETPDGQDSKQYIDQKINELITKLPTVPNQEEQKAIIDRLCIMNHRKPQFGTVSMAAYATTSTIPDVPLPRKVRDALGKVMKKYGNNVPGFAGQTPQVQPQPVAPQQPPTGPARAGAGEMQQQKGASPLGSLLRKKPQ